MHKDCRRDAARVQNLVSNVGHGENCASFMRPLHTAACCGGSPLAEDLFEGFRPSGDALTRHDRATPSCEMLKPLRSHHVSDSPQRSPLSPQSGNVSDSLLLRLNRHQLAIVAAPGAERVLAAEEAPARLLIGLHL